LNHRFALSSSCAAAKTTGVRCCSTLFCSLVPVVLNRFFRNVLDRDVLLVAYTEVVLEALDGLSGEERMRI